jgi:hypothetical protein
LVHSASTEVAGVLLAVSDTGCDFGSFDELNPHAVKLSLHSTSNNSRVTAQPHPNTMRLSIAAIAAGCAMAHAFTNTSPFVMFSTEKYVHGWCTLASSL